MLLTMLLILGLGPATGHSGDWPQILGPHRNGIAVDEPELAIPESGPPTVWQAPIGSGFAGPVVEDGTLVLFHREQDEDTYTAFDAVTGERKWSRGFRTTFQPSIVEDDGPRATPTIHRGRVYGYASNGRLDCLDLKTGTPVWQRQTHQDFMAPAGYFGAGSSPLVEGRLLIVNVGGDRANAGVVAFDLETGKTAWQSVRDQASYSSPVAVTIDGRRYLLCITRLNLVSLDPKTGDELFRTPFGQRGPTVNGAIPVFLKDQALLTASYGIGARLLKLHADRVEITWEDEILSSQYTTPIVHEGLVYGIDGRQDGGPVSLKCFDPVTRQLRWEHPGIPYATLIASGNQLLMMHTQGTLTLVELIGRDYRELGSASLLKGTTRALPALSRGRLYVRNEHTLKCVSLVPSR